MAKIKQERRKSPRYQAPDSWLEFHTSGLLGLFKRANAHRAEVENLGPYGLCIRSPVELKPGKTVPVKITVPLLESPVESQAKVIWCRSIHRTSAYQVGMQFVVRDAAFRAWMAEFEEKAGEISVPARCPHCQHLFRAKQWLIGQSAKCPSCQKTIKPLERIADAEFDGGALRSAEDVFEAMDDMGGADGGTVKGSVLHPRIQHFLMKYVASPTHLGLVEFIHGRDGTKIDLKEASRRIDCREVELRRVCDDFVALDILKKVNDVYIYNPDMVARRDVNDFMRDYSDAETKTKVLAFVMAATQEAEG